MPGGQFGLLLVQVGQLPVLAGPDEQFQQCIPGLFAGGIGRQHVVQGFDGSCRIGQGPALHFGQFLQEGHSIAGGRGHFGLAGQ